MRMRITSLTLALAVAFGCTEPKASGNADLVGQVVNLEAAPSAANARVLIRGAYTADPRDMVTDFVVRVDGPVYLEDGDDSLRPVSVSSIREGDRLRVWTTGVELRSLPPQVTSRTIVIDRD
jgi:hypothetical protein